MGSVIGGAEIKGLGRPCFAREEVAMAPCMCLPNNSSQLTRQVELCLESCGSRASARLWHARHLGPGLAAELLLGRQTCGRTHVNELCAAMQRVARERSRWIHGRLLRAIGGFVGVCLVPSAAHAHGQEVLVPLAGSIYAFPLFVLVVIGLPARLNTKLWCIAAYVAGTPIAWLGTAGLVTRENANFVVFSAGVLASVLGLIPWIATPKGKR